MDVLLTSSALDTGISCWDIHNGAELTRYRSCASPRHGLVSVGHMFLASSQLHNKSSGAVLFWSWHRPQVETKSFPEENIKPLVSNDAGTYLIGGGVSGHIYVWEVTTGRLLMRWHGHYRAITCLVLSKDGSFLVSGADDGCVRVWSLLLMFDDVQRLETGKFYVHSFLDHTLPVTDVVTGHGGRNDILLSASEDRTCKVYSLYNRKLLRNLVFPAVVDAIALNPGEQFFYAGCRDGKIYIAAFHAGNTKGSKYGMHILGILSEQSKAVTCLTFGSDRMSLVVGYDDGVVRIWDTKTHNIKRVFKHAKGPITNVIVGKRPPNIGSQTPMQLPVPALRKHVDPADDDGFITALPCTRNCDAGLNFSHLSADPPEDLEPWMNMLASETGKKEQLGGTSDIKRMQRWEEMFEDLHEFCIKELLDGVNK